MLTVPALLVLLLFAFGTTIFYVLLATERRVWGLARDGDPARYAEEDLRFVHRSLKHLIPILPPSNGVVVVGGFAALVWQGVQRGWDGRAVAVLAFDVAGQFYIIGVGRIAAAVRDVRTTPSDAPVPAVARGVRQLIRQHRNGLGHALGVLLLELVLVVVPEAVRGRSRTGAAPPSRGHAAAATSCPECRRNGRPIVLARNAQPRFQPALAEGAHRVGRLRARVHPGAPALGLGSASGEQRPPHRPQFVRHQRLQAWRLPRTDSQVVKQLVSSVARVGAQEGACWALAAPGRSGASALRNTTLSSPAA